MLKKLLILIMLAVPSSFNLALAAGWTNGKQIITATIWRPGYHGFYVAASNFHNPEGCGTPSSEKMYLFDPVFETADEKTVDRLFSMILTAQTSGKKLHVYVDGCVNQFPKITGLQLNE